MLSDERVYLPLRKVADIPFQHYKGAISISKFGCLPAYYIENYLFKSATSQRDLVADLKT